MSSTTLSAIKVISTLGLGLLAGHSIASSFIVTRMIHTLSKRSNAPALARDQLLPINIQSVSAASISVALLGVYARSPDFARHPYLLYTSVLALGLSVSSKFLVAQKMREIGTLDLDALNGEDVTNKIDKLVLSGYITGAFGTLGFLASAIGNYGDYYLLGQ